MMGLTAIGFYIVLSLISANALADSIASLGLAVAFYYGITAFSCVWYFRRTLFTSARHFFMRGLLPLLGGIGMAAAFIISAKDMLDPEYGFTAFGPIGGVFVIGVGMLALGVPLMIACAVRFGPSSAARRSMRTRRSWYRTPAQEPVALRTRVAESAAEHRSPAVDSSTADL